MDKLTGGFYLKEVNRWFRRPILVAMVEVEVEEITPDPISRAMGMSNHTYHYREATPSDIRQLKAMGLI